jgi:hypothetical protein
VILPELSLVRRFLPRFTILVAGLPLPPPPEANRPLLSLL